MPYGCRSQNVKGQGHNAVITENGFWHITAFPLHLQSSNFMHRFHVSQGYALLILGQKTWEFELVAAGGICPVRTAPF